MKILIIDDSKTKSESIETEINKFYKERANNTNLEIKTVECLVEVHQPILTTKFDLIIFDIYLPKFALPDETENCAKDIIYSYKDSINANTDAIVVTQQPNSEDSVLFNEHGVTFIEYEQTGNWKSTLKRVLEKVSKKLRYDFIIFCALTKERKAFKHTQATVGQLTAISGLDCQEISIADKKGLCIKPHRMGLISMAITTTKAIELFDPLFVGLSGVCAGKSETSKILDIVLCDMAWEYQAGKYTKGAFIQEPYQTPITSEMQNYISHFLESDNLNEIVCKDLETHRYIEKMNFIKGPMASGSLVVADSCKMEEISSGHRKMAGLEMEISAFYEAAQQASSKPQYLAIKTVTDLGDDNKSSTDDLQDMGAIMSARCLIEFIDKFF